jgi:hypothetical protein
MADDVFKPKKKDPFKPKAKAAPAVPSEVQQSQMGAFDTYDGPTISAAEKPMGYGETVLHMLPQGMTQKFSDEITGGIQALRHGDTTTENVNGLNLTTRPVDVFRGGRDTERELIEKAKRDNPKLAAVTELGGNLMSSYLGLSNPTLGILLNAVGGAGGDLTRAVDPDPVTGRDEAVQAVGEMGENAALGLGTMQVLKDAGPDLARVGGSMVPQKLKDFVRSLADGFRNVGQDVKDYSYERAAKSVASGRNVDKLVGPLEAPHRTERIREMGKFMLEEPQPALGGKTILRAGQDAKGTGERFGTVQKEAGKQYGEVTDTLSAAEATTDRVPSIQVADDMENALAGRGGTYDVASQHPQRAFVGREAGEVRDFHLDDYGIKDLEALKRGFQTRADYEHFSRGDNAETLKDIAAFYRKYGEDRANDLVEQYAPELRGQFETAKRLYRLSSAGVNASEAETGRMLRNRDISLSDMLLAQGAKSDGSLEQLTKEAILRRVFGQMRKRGASSVATSANSLGRYIEEIPDVVPPAVGNSAVRTLLEDPQHRANFLEWLKSQGSDDGNR